MQITQSLLVRYFCGQCNSAEEEAVQEFIAADKHAPLVESAMNEAYKEQPLLLLSEDEHTAAWNTFRQKSGWQPARVRRLHWWRYAAAVLLLLGSFTVWQTRRSASTTATESAPLTYYASTGIRKHITLADGSDVYLFPGSSLTIPAQFNERQRTVQLKGRAFFDVTQDPAKPFAVHAGALTTDVLGTSFEVMEADRQLWVTVRSGKVGVRKGGRPLSSLLPEQQLRYLALKDTFSLHHTGIAAGSWINGELAFEETPLPEIFATLEQWYGITIQLDVAKWQHKKVSVKFRKQPVGNVLQVLSLTTGFHYKITGKHIIIN